MNKSFWTAFQEDDGAWSWGRVIGALPAITSCFCVILLTFRQKPPEPLSLAAWGAFAISCFGASKAIQAWKDKGQP